MSTIGRLVTPNQYLEESGMAEEVSFLSVVVRVVLVVGVLVAICAAAFFVFLRVKRWECVCSVIHRHNAYSYEL